MKFIDKLERKFGNRGIENLTIYIIVSYVLGYALMFLNPELLSMLTLNVTQILHGQIWRLITWVIYPPTTTNLFLFIIVIVCFYYPVSSSLEHTWGSFKFTLYTIYCNFGIYIVFYYRRSFGCFKWSAIYNLLY